ncbi:MAG: glycine cleavage system protein GcvH [Candidatus Omnitrophota bacterium]
MIPGDLKYTSEHEWVRVKGDEAVVGITDHAQSALGDITFIELPGEGDTLTAGESMGTVESVKAASDIYAPLSGSVIEVNSALEDAPEAINASPYEKGWICRMKISDKAEADSLMDASGYQKYLKESE